MKIYIDFSVLTATGDAIGRVSGLLDFPAVPTVGTTIAMIPAESEVKPPDQIGFNGHLKVVAVIFRPSLRDGSVAISLADAVATSVESAKSLMRYFRESFHLSADEY